MATITAATTMAASCSVPAVLPSARPNGKSGIVVFMGKQRSVSRGVAYRAIRASAEEVESAQPSKTGVFISSLVGAAAALSVTLSGSSLATSGPGIDGAERTANKADELLKAADTLTTNESPPRFGPGRSAPDETSQLAQKAGSGPAQALQGIQQGVGKSGEQAKDIVGQVQDDVKSSASDVASKASNVTDQSPNLFSSIQGAFQNLTGSANSEVEKVKDKADNVVADAKSNLPGQ